MTSNTYTCFVVDDQKSAANTIENYIKQTPGLKLVGGSQNAIEALKEIEKSAPDILFTDINMPDLSGIELTKRLQLIPTLVIFTTSYKGYALDAIELNALHYLLKPVSYEKFMQAVHRAITAIETKGKNPESAHGLIAAITVNVKGNPVEIAFNDIYYIEASRNNIIINLESTAYTIVSTLADFETKLPKDQFLQVHRSFIVSTSKIIRIDSNSIVLSNEQILPVGRSYFGLLRKQVL
jgi:DNA-binding LytR/AlgR family response regulator